MCTSKMYDELIKSPTPAIKLLMAYYFFIVAGNSKYITWNVVEEESYLYISGSGNIVRFNSTDETVCRELAKKYFAELLFTEANNNRKESGLHFVRESWGTGCSGRTLRMDVIDSNYINAPGEFIPCVSSLKYSDINSERYILNKMMEASGFAGILLQISFIM